MRTSVKVKHMPVDVPGKVTIKVGILDGDKRYEGEQRSDVVLAFAPSLATPSVGEVAEQHEFGLGVPQRSWLREWFDSKKSEIMGVAKQQFGAAMRAAAPVEPAARRVAFAAEDSIKRRITDEKPFKPLAPETIAERIEKGRGQPPYTPLVDTGLLLSSIAADAEVTA